MKLMKWFRDKKFWKLVLEIIKYVIAALAGYICG